MTIVVESMAQAGQHRAGAVAESSRLFENNRQRKTRKETKTDRQRETDIKAWYGPLKFQSSLPVTGLFQQGHTSNPS